ncbi:MAG: hypothetical protein UY74_C0061G0005 [Candidatus Kaiserbacteria bacterium GW2011_GWC2_52_8b]|uniref:Uncharacterized protein n=2 Tax=Candidatus Kaiseribacteriota TaxID=1752734 RepID=A0A0G1XG26_9BACT|nr:MAG: hypothetical protein UY67_C0017G0014 [Candidatus Kaiserbacteria bacterium GW2011_GWA2_52_12]KKW29865.1 MAG: hypothetical protein UY74_C0061G0005 [Candidatus Kaiserbacteria bacterium GW2011_GWC2_52_8b]
MGFVSSDKTAVKIVFLLTATMLLWFGTFGLLQHMSAMNMGGEIGGCLFNSQQEVCILSLSDHAAFWQQMIATIPFIDLLILAFLFVVVAFWLNPLREFREGAASRWRFYVRQHPRIRLFNSLMEAFRAGILNRKVFISARV